jgi:hypothetical protein
MSDELKIPPKALAAIDILLKTISQFQDELSNLDESCSIFSDFLTELKSSTADKMLDRSKTVYQHVNHFMKYLEILKPLVDLAQAEIQAANQGA